MAAFSCENLTSCILIGKCGEQEDDVILELDSHSVARRPPARDAPGVPVKMPVLVLHCTHTENLGWGKRICIFFLNSSELFFLYFLLKNKICLLQLRMQTV